MFKTLAAFILRSQMHAAGTVGLFGTLAWVFPLLSYLSCAALALVVLSKGVQQAIPVMIGAGIFSGLIAFVTLGTPLLALAMTLAVWIPTMIVAEALARSRSQSIMILVASGLAILLAITLRLFMADVDGFWLQLIERLVERSQAQGAFLDADFRQTIAAAMNGIVSAGLALTLTVSVMIGRWWQSTAVNPGGFAEEFRQIMMPKGLAILLAVLLGWMIFGKVGVQSAGIMLDISMILMLAFMFAGLAFIHQAFHATGKSTSWLIGLYVFLFIAFVYAVSALAVLGVVTSLTGKKLLKQ